MPVLLRGAALLAGLALVGLTGCEEERGVGRAERGKSLERASALSASIAKALRCPGGSWPMYAHDARRTSATVGCCRAPLSPLWSFVPPPKPPRESRIHHAIATKDMIFASGVIGESPSVFALSHDGKLVWTFDSHVDITRHEWPSYVLDRVILNDDGLYILDPRSGEQEVNRGLDSWGQVITNGRNLFATNTWYIAGPKTYVGALEAGGAPLWKHHQYGVVREDVMDRLGGIAIGGDLLVFAPNYTPSPGSGVYGHATEDGAFRFSMTTLPKSHVTFVGETLYLFERLEGAEVETLVARGANDGKVRWTFNAESLNPTAPVAVQGKVIFREKGGAVVAVRRGEGTLAWRTPLAPPEAGEVGWATSLAAASGSSTLLAVDGKELAVLSLDDGRVEWRGRPGLTAAPHSPVIAGGRLYVTHGTGLAALGCAPP